MLDTNTLICTHDIICSDDTWSLPERDNKTKKIVPDPVKFPSGMKALGDYIHSKGLKFGIYSDAGLQTCAGYPGSNGHEDVDAKTFKAWGVGIFIFNLIKII